MSIGTGHGVADPELAPRGPRRPGKKWKLALVAILGAYAVLSVYELVTNGGEIRGGASTPTATTAAASTAPGKAVPSGPTRAAAASPPGVKHPSPKPTQPTRTAVSPAVHPLGVASITAFGPEGTSDGDNPGITYRILDVGTEQPWFSQWYTTPSFGGLRTGTGLLLDLGETETVSDVVLTLGSTPGTDVQVRAGNGPFLGLPTVASVFDVGGTVRITTTSAQGRYVLIWFTRLPPDGRGHYQASVYNVSVDGVSR